MPPWLTDTVMVAAIGAAGLIVGNLLTGITQYKTSQMSLMKAQVGDLEKRVAALERERDDAVKAAREAERLLWHALEYLRRVLSWAHEVVELLPDGVDAPAEPEPPEQIGDHL